LLKTELAFCPAYIQQTKQTKQLHYN